MISTHGVGEVLDKIKVKLKENYFAEHSRWIHWVPVGLIFGIASYFNLNNEPGIFTYLSLVSIGFIGIISAIYKPNFRLFSFIITSFCIGFCIIGIRVHFNSTEMFRVPQEGAKIAGRIESIENHPYKEDGSYRIVLDHVLINEESYSAKLRVNISATLAKELNIHDHLKVTGNIYPIPMPSSLHGYFARRSAYLQSIGGTISTDKVLQHQKAKEKPFAHYRYLLTQNLLLHLSEPYSAIAAALVTGDRSYIPHQLRKAFTDAGLAHILAISGLHLSLVTLLVFLILRRLMCLLPTFSMAFPVKKLAACLAVLASMGYMAIANFGIPVQRSFIMISLAMLAVCLDRTAFSMRSLVLAATIVLLLAPESLLSASFQLSFSAVLGLLAFYESVWSKLQEKVFQQSSKFLGTKKLLWGLFGILSTTLVASLATSAFSIAFFQHFTAQAILGNLLAIPLVGFVVMPLGLFSVFSLTFGGSDALFYLWEKSLSLLCSIAQKTSLLPGASILVKAVPSHALAIFSFGMLWLCLWKKTWRWLGIFPIVLGIVLWRIHELPLAYISAKNDVMAYKENNTIYISEKGRNSFSIDNWAQEWGISDQKMWDKHYHHFESANLLLITSPKEGIEYLHKFYDSGEKVDTVITFGYARTLKKHGFKIKNVIDRNIIQHEGGVAVFSNPVSLCFLKSYFGYRPWCVYF